MVIIAFAALTAGDLVLLGVLAVISLIGLRELYKVFKMEHTALMVLGNIFVLLYYALVYWKQGGKLLGESLNWFMALYMAFLICLMAAMVFRYPKYHPSQIVAAFFGFSMWQ